MNLPPLIAWLILAATVAGILVADGTLLYCTMAAAAVLYIAAITARWQVLLLLPFAAVSTLAPLITLPLPGSWPGLIRLALTLFVWLVAGVSLTAFTISVLVNKFAENYGGGEE